MKKNDICRGPKFLDLIFSLNPIKQLKVHDPKKITERITAETYGISLNKIKWNCYTTTTARNSR